LLRADVSAAELVAGRLQGAHGQRVSNLEVITQSLIYNQLAAFKDLRKYICDKKK